MCLINGDDFVPGQLNAADGGMVGYVRAKINAAMSVVGTGNYEAIYGGLHPDSDTEIDNGSGTAAANGPYWTSSEWSAGSAFILGIGANGCLSLERLRGSGKLYPYRVRAVLAF